MLLDLDLPLGAVLGTFGVERHAITFHGQAAHSGSTPMNRRKDAFLAAAKMSPEIYRIAERHGGVCTIGSCTDQTGHRHQRRRGMPDHARPAAPRRRRRSRKCCTKPRRPANVSRSEGNVTRRVGTPLADRAMPFQSTTLIAFCDEAIRETCGKSHRLPSGPLHDAAEVARAGVPTVMMFVQSLHGISHNKIEDTKEEHLELALRAFDGLATKTIAWLASR